MSALIMISLLVLGVTCLGLIAHVVDIKDQLKFWKNNFESRIDALERGEFKDYGTDKDKPGF